MWYLIAGVLLFAVSGALGLSRYRSGSFFRSDPMGSVIDSLSLRSLSMGQINSLLARLEVTDPPEEVMGAMCYEAMAYPDVAEYVCPVCGEKTIYEDRNTGFIEYELPGARRLAAGIDSLTAFPVVLDETLFCAHCSPGLQDEPYLRLRVSTTDSTVVENRVTLTDLRMLEYFLQGKLYYNDGRDAHLPLQEHVDRLRELLGISAG